VCKYLIAGLVLGCSVLLLAGCGNTADPGGANKVTLHVAGMSERLELT
jgi:hypothetical protein